MSKENLRLISPTSPAKAVNRTASPKIFPLKNTPYAAALKEVVQGAGVFLANRVYINEMLQDHALHECKRITGVFIRSTE